MESKEFEAELLRRVNALRIPFSLKRDYIKIGKFKVKVLDPVLGDARKCNVALYKEDKLVFEKPCTTYYLTQYLTTKIKLKN